MKNIRSDQQKPTVNIQIISLQDGTYSWPFPSPPIPKCVMVDMISQCCHLLGEDEARSKAWKEEPAWVFSVLKAVMGKGWRESTVNMHTAKGPGRHHQQGGGPGMLTHTWPTSQFQPREHPKRLSPLVMLQVI